MPTINQEITDRYAIYHADCMEILPEVPNASVGMTVYSPPFPELYQYSNDPRDMCNCVNYDESIEQYRHIVKEIYRTLMSGRITAVHCIDLKKGPILQRDFPGDIIRVHEEMGFGFFCRITIWRDAWDFARRTRMKTLMHKTITIDSSMSRTCPPDYVLVFKKPGQNDVPIAHPNGLSHYAGDTPIPASLIRKYRDYTGDQKKNLLSHWIWRRYASPIWMDIRRHRLLPYRSSKEKEEEKHVCPLQLDTIERCLTLWSNREETILTPFMGVGSEVFVSIMMGRKAIGCELKESYYRQATKNIKHAQRCFDEGVFEEQEKVDEAAEPEEAFME